MLKVFLIGDCGKLFGGEVVRLRKGLLDERPGLGSRLDESGVLGKDGQFLLWLLRTVNDCAFKVHEDLSVHCYWVEMGLSVRMMDKSMSGERLSKTNQHTCSLYLD